MSDPPTPSLNPHTSPLTTFHHHRPPPVPPPPSSLPSSSATHNPSSPSSSSPLAREYRKGNWTVHETLILITAKRLNDERRSSSRCSSSSSSSSLALDSKQQQQPTTNTTTNPQCRSAELRWKWVENYCWRNGCLRSQNQCNDKWDNLLRDYKKVRDYESRVPPAGPSYWNMEKHERKDRNLPSNLASEVYHALTDVLSRRNAHKAAAHHHQHHSQPHSQPQPQLQPQPQIQQQPQQQQQQQQPIASPRPPPSVTPLLPPPHLHHPQPQPVPPPPPESTGAETSGKSESPGKGGEPNAKRRKKARDLGSSVARGASELSRTLLACEEMREKRHKDLVEIEARRLRMEEDRTEMSRQGIAGLIAAVNGLSGAIHALVSDRQLHHRRRNDEC